MPRRTFAALLAAVAVSSLASFASAADLNVGDKAPALKVGKWIQGEPVTKFDDDKIYVVEFWATWCGPCKATIPHLSEMSKTYKDVVFIGQDVFENDAEAAAVEPFVKEMGDKMSYRVATDDRSDGGAGVMAATWMEAAAQDGIPTAFVVAKGGTIAWIGHPMQLEPVLKKVVDGTYDLATAKSEAAAAGAKQNAAKEMQQEFTKKVGPLLKSKDFKGAAKAIDDMIAAHPDQKNELLGVKFGICLADKDYDAAYPIADEIAAAFNDDPEKLNQLAWTIVDSKQIEKRDFARAEKYATRAAELTENKEPAILDTLARTHAEQGHYDKAIELQTKAVSLSPADQKADMQKTLDEYKTKAAK